MQIISEVGSDIDEKVYGNKKKINKIDSIYELEGSIYTKCMYVWSLLEIIIIKVKNNRYLKCRLHY